MIFVLTFSVEISLCGLKLTFELHYAICNGNL